MINEAANTFDRFRLSTINMIGWCIFLTRFYLFTWVTLIINSTVLNFYFCTRCSDWLILKNESKTINSVGWRLNFQRQKNIPAKEFFVSKIFFLPDYLLTRSFTFDLHPHQLIHYGKSYVKHFTVRLIDGHWYNFWQNHGRKTSKIKRLFESDLRYFSNFKCFIGLGFQKLCSWTRPEGLQYHLDPSNKSVLHGSVDWFAHKHYP